MISFLTEYIRHPRTTGAIAPSSRYLARKMAEQINYKNTKTIIELGPGTGVFTKEILKRKKADTTLILIEINQTFVKQLQSQFKDVPNLHIIHGSAENMKDYLQELHLSKIDVVLSGLPFTSMPAAVSKNILNRISDFLDDDGSFLTFQYSLVKKAFIQQFFQSIELKKVWGNLPPAYVLSCKKVGD
ncbi:class I SAM-dependent methyltransferase [Sutcliffiella horikoshii]|uniref:class I SAM-dependent methyltransferase n=1 Tax=Sutcliffiella horikoshii TaxID=79883 RepID=UPI001F23C28B|nr:rRNA adenine N-6-methyltransferase family protein [Sutcliffiella horikoshii]MCG1023389.1 methyltransferase domain-containing protein [Sutcliffiella horikoshii]